ncbi:MAG TPA: RHS repeat-associated core domain-containing protein [Gammaproteobacteria bacterium]|jgi:RHS repeat-associated protein|nr:RHS repeat-associated core domain-containing protein [Gammaproteobacteria bacterium]
MKRNKFPLVAFTLAIAALGALAPVYADQPNLTSGVGQNSGSNGSAVDSVDLQTGRLLIHLPLPILSPQRGGRLNVGFSLIGNAPIWSVVTQDGPFNSSCQNVTGTTTGCWTPNFGNRNTNLGHFPNGQGDTTQLEWSLDVQFNRQVVTEFNAAGRAISATESDHFLTTPDGGNHHLQDISPAGDGSQWMTIDGTGYKVFLGSKNTLGIYTAGTIIDRTGNSYALSFRSYGCSGTPQTGERICNNATQTTQIEDVDGNLYTLVNPNSGGLEAGMDTRGVVLPTQGAQGTASTACPSGTSASSFAFSYLGYQGSLQTITECYAIFAMSTGFGQPGIAEYSNTNGPRLLTAAIMPDGLKYTFGYDSYGNLTSIGLPQGGTISYTWQTLNFALGSCGNAAQLSRGVQTRTLNDNNGHSYTWTYSYRPLNGDGTITNTVTDPNGNDSDAVFSEYSTPQGGNVPGATACSGLVQTATRVYSGSGSTRALLAETDVQYQAQAMQADRDSTTDSTPIVGNVYATTTTTRDAVTGLVKKVVRTPDLGLGAGKPTLGETLQNKIYDWGRGAPGPLLQEADTTYMWQIDNRYLTAGILDIPASIVVKDGNGNRIGEADDTYDAPANLIASGVTLQHGPAPNSVRGNLSSIATFLNTGSGAGATVTKPFDFYDTGERVDDIQPANNAHRTKFTYDATGTYVIEVDMPSTTNSVLAGKPTVAHVIKSGYDFNTGLLTSSTDQNGNVSTFNYRADNGLLVSAAHPDGGGTSYGYANNFTTDEVQNNIAPGIHTDSVTQVDGLGRRLSQQTLTGGGNVETDYSYDAFGRVSAVSNPHYAGAGPTDGQTRNQYDALGRLSEVIEADNSVLQKTFSQTVSGVSGICTVATDEQFRNRESCTDALGRLTAVIEDPMLASNPDAGGLNMETDYSYTTTANGSTQVTITQKGEPGTAQALWRVHTQTLDSLGRLISATNPETGTLTYTYDNNGNVLTRTDGRNITATYTYDELNRLLRTAYNDGKTQNALYLYDYPQTGSQISSNTVGTVVATSTGGSRWFISSYDAMGRPTALYQCPGDSNGNPVNCTSSTASYDLIGDMKSLSAPDGRTINYTYDQTGWVQSAKDAGGAVYVSAVNYAPNGNMTAIVTPNFTYNYVYNNRFQPTQIAIGSSTQSLMVMDYDYGAGNDNGNVLEITDELDDSRSQSYTYDTLNRLRAANSGSATNATCKQLRHSDFQCTPGQDVWAESLSYDDWGNLISKTNIGGAGEQVSITVDAGNRISQYVNQAGQTLLPSYDPAGNMTTDGVSTYSFDGWNRLVAAGNTNYVYGPDSERWSKSVNGGAAFLYYYGVNGQIIADQSGSAVTDYVYLGGARLAALRGNAADYYLSDVLGSTAKVVDQNGKLLDDQEFYPFGGSVPGVGGIKTGNYFQFTGQPRDVETGLDYFGARYYSNVLGRWVSADWSPFPSPIPYASMTAPQSMNLYSYAENNPASSRDVNGHFIFSNLIGEVCDLCDSPADQGGATVIEDIGDEPDIIDVNVGPCTLCADNSPLPAPDLNAVLTDTSYQFSSTGGQYTTTYASADGSGSVTTYFGSDVISQLLGSMMQHPDPAPQGSQESSTFELLFGGINITAGCCKAGMKLGTVEAEVGAGIEVERSVANEETRTVSDFASLQVGIKGTPLDLEGTAERQIINQDQFQWGNVQYSGSVGAKGFGLDTSGTASYEICPGACIGVNVEKTNVLFQAITNFPISPIP